MVVAPGNVVSVPTSAEVPLAEPTTEPTTEAAGAVVAAATRCRCPLRCPLWFPLRCRRPAGTTTNPIRASARWASSASRWAVGTVEVVVVLRRRRRDTVVLGPVEVVAAATAAPGPGSGPAPATRRRTWRGVGRKAANPLKRFSTAPRRSASICSTAAPLTVSGRRDDVGMT